MFLTWTRSYLLPMQPPARLEHIFWEDLGKVSVSRTPTAHTNLHRNISSPYYIQNLQSMSARLPRGAPTVYLIPNTLRVIFKNTEIIASLNTTVWSVWTDEDPRTSNVFLADFNTTGISAASRPHFSTELTSSEAAAYSIASTVGDDYEKWVDASYIV